MPAQVESLKQELFSYWAGHLQAAENDLRTAGFSTHLDTLYKSWDEAVSDFNFYQFVNTAQEYLGVTSPKDEKSLRKKLAEYALHLGLSDEDRLLISELGEEAVPQERREELLDALTMYIIENPPAYNQDYSSGLERVFKREPSPKFLSIERSPQEAEAELQRTSPGYAPPIPAGFGLLKEQVEQVLSGPDINETERRVLGLRFGLEDGRSRTLEEVGRELNYSRENVRKIEAGALRKIRHPTRTSMLRGFLE